MLNKPDWPIGRVSQEVILFTKEKGTFLEDVLNSLHEFTTVVNPYEDGRELADKYGITRVPTVVYIYKDKMVCKLEEK